MRIASHRLLVARWPRITYELHQHRVAVPCRNLCLYGCFATIAVVVRVYPPRGPRPGQVVACFRAVVRFRTEQPRHLGSIGLHCTLLSAPVYEYSAYTTTCDGFSKRASQRVRYVTPVHQGRFFGTLTLIVLHGLCALSSIGFWIYQRRLAGCAAPRQVSNG